MYRYVYFILLFLCLLKEKEQKKRHPWFLVLRTALRSSKLPGICKLASLNGGELCQCDMVCASTMVLLLAVTVKPSAEQREADKQCKFLFSSFCGAQQEPMGSNIP